MILSGEPIEAEDALRWGLVDRVVDGNLDVAVDEELTRCARSSR